MVTLYVLLMIAMVVAAYYVGRQQAAALSASGAPLHSLPSYHGFFLAMMVGLPMLVLMLAWLPVSSRMIESAALSRLSVDLQPVDALSRDARLRDIELVVSGTATPDRLAQLPAAIVEAGNHAASLISSSMIGMILTGLLLAAAAGLWGRSRITPTFRARNTVERIVLWFLLACSAVAVLTTVGIVFSVVFETLRFFTKVSPLEFLLGLQWSPQTALRADQVGSSGAFGAVPLFVGTALIMLIAMLVAGPVGLFAAIYMSEYASPRFRSIAKPILEVLAGIPTVVFGFFAALTVAPAIRGWGEAIGLDVSSESALAAGLVMGVMIIPFVSSLSDDVINAVPQSLRDGSYALGATKSETIRRVVLPAALPGIVSAFMLAISRAVGETMIVVMAAGLAANLTFNPLEAVTTVTVQIKTLLVGDQEFDSAKTLSAFALGFVLFFFTLALNIVAQAIVKRFREQYE
jgi:phosphate transport system permease protein